MKYDRVARLGRNQEIAPQCHTEKNRARCANFVREDESSSAWKKSLFVNRATLATFVAALPSRLGSVMFAKQHQAVLQHRLLARLMVGRAPSRAMSVTGLGGRRLRVNTASDKNWGCRFREPRNCILRALR